MKDNFKDGCGLREGIRSTEVSIRTRVIRPPLSAISPHLIQVTVTQLQSFFTSVVVTDRSCQHSCVRNSETSLVRS